MLRLLSNYLVIIFYIFYYSINGCLLPTTMENSYFFIFHICRPNYRYYEVFSLFLLDLTLVLSCFYLGLHGQGTIL